MTNTNIPLHVVFVEAWIKKGDKYLLARRSSKDEQAAGRWAVPGGKVDMEIEDHIIENSLKREIMEEVGIEADNFKFFASRSFIRASGHHVVGLSFVADYKSGEAMPLEDQDEVRWVTMPEMEDLLDEHWDEILKELRKIT
ncbi:MAG: NUDIX domain-containing protein [bacterium]